MRWVPQTQYLPRDCLIQEGSDFKMPFTYQAAHREALVIEVQGLSGGAHRLIMAGNS